jgi:hypothetical protein
MRAIYACADPLLRRTAAAALDRLGEAESLNPFKRLAPTPRDHLSGASSNYLAAA